MKRYLLFAIWILGQTIFAQEPQKPSSAEIFAAIQKLQVLGSVLYVAAHPDDENTRMISFFANQRHMHTTYLSLTRGDGGQNLVGPEIREYLGVIRTQELLQARSIDGGHQMFTRANDFGYSKHPDETLKLWDKEEVLSDVVWAIRRTRPDIIINRFDHRTAGRTHGHHTSSAVLSTEAFNLVNDADRFPEQLKYVKPWQPRRLFFNTSWWFYGSRERFEEADKSNMLTIDVGVYYPLLGYSNNEIAAASRSMHKSQGFGATGSRGTELEYIELIDGEKFENDPFDGIDVSWGRVDAPHIGTSLREIESNFNIADPSQSVAALAEVYQEMRKLPDDGFWVPMKLREIQQVIAWCAGIFVEAVADNYVAAPGESLPVYLEAINRSTLPVTLQNVRTDIGQLDSSIEAVLQNNVRFNKEVQLILPNHLKYSTPYWLAEEGTIGMYSVPDQLLRGSPQNQEPVSVKYDIEIEGVTLNYTTPVVYKRNDPVDGEVYRPFEVSPPVYLNITEDVLVFGAPTSKNIGILVKANRDSLVGEVEVLTPEDWGISPKKLSVKLAAQGMEELLQFELIPPNHPSEAEIQVVFTLDDPLKQTFSQGATIIEYDHIPTQTILKPAKAKVVKIDLDIVGSKVGYIEGAGDKIPDFLRQVGYEVSMLDEDDFTSGHLSEFDAIITGIRAYNTSDRIRFYQDALFKYVEEGGTLIVQYNTSRRLKADQLAPFHLQLSRDRVTVEDAEVRIIAPDHPVIKGPNTITDQDFEGWVQERGLYFADEWDDRFVPILSSNDPGETPKDGGLLVAPYGKGWYIYTGYSWFRELPAGVPGAFRIFTNMISLGKRSEP